MLVGTGTGMLMAPDRLSVLGKMPTPRRYRDPIYAQASAPSSTVGECDGRPTGSGAW